MALKFQKLTRTNTRKVKPGDKLQEHGISFERLQNGDGRYTVNIMVDGIRIHRAIGKESEGVTRKQVENFIEQARTDARKGRLNLPEGRKVILGFRTASANYLKKLMQEGGKDLKMKQYRLEMHLNPFLKDKPLPKVSTFDVERYKKYRLESKAAPGTVNRELAALSHLYSKAIEWKWIDHKPMIIKRLKEDSGRITYLTTEQMARILEEAKKDQNPNIYPFIIIGLETSMRRMEILSIRIEDINLEKRTIYIPKAKAGARDQPITKHLTLFLSDFLKSKPPAQEWLFPSKRAKDGHTVAIEKPFKRVVIAAGMDPNQVVRHTLRHTAITHLVQAGVDLPTVQRISGHKTLQMVAKYSHQNGEHIQTAMDKLEERYKGVSP
jgi:integrase